MTISIAPDPASGKTRPTDRSWVVLVIATVTAASTAPGQTIGVSVFIDHFVADLALTREEVSGAYLVGTLAGAALLPMVGKLVDRRGVRLAQVVVGAAFGLAVAHMATVNGLIWLAIGFVGIRFLGQGALSLVATLTVSLRFDHRRGTALGSFSTGTAALMALAPVLLALAIDRFGWRTAWVVAGAVVAAIVVPIGWFGLRALPRGSRSAAAHGDHGDDGPRSFTRREAFGTRSLWALLGASATASMLITALNFHQIDLMGDAGISETAAAALFVPQVIGSTAAALAAGWLGDRYGMRYAPAAAMALLCAASLTAAVVAPGLAALAYSVLLGSALGAILTATAALLPMWFGPAHLGSIQATLTFLSFVGAAVGPLALAIAEATTDGYPGAVSILAIVPAVAGAFSLGATQPERPERS